VSLSIPTLRGAFKIDRGIALGLSAPYCKYSILSVIKGRRIWAPLLLFSEEGK